MGNREYILETSWKTTAQRMKTQTGANS
jgi:hypothetical protein